MSDIYAENHQNDPDNNPTADAAKLLPCPFCGTEPVWIADDSYGNSHVICQRCDIGFSSCDFPIRERAVEIRLETIIAAWNTRPQPAPPDTNTGDSKMEINHASDCALHNEPALSAEQCDCGAQPSEPDWETIIEQAFFVIGIKTLTRDEIRAELIALARHAYGLSARPKVEDAEVAYAVGALRNPAFMAGEGAPQHKEEQCRSDRETAADLLERLSVERDGLVNRALLILDAKNEWHDRAMAAESKLAEREAELARADAVIHGMAHHMYYVARDEDAAEKRHAARQQQKASAEPTEREDRS